MSHMRWFPMLALFCGAAFAQNTDLGILGGVSGPVSEVVSGTAAAGPIGSRREIASVTGTTVTKFDQYRVSLAGGIGGGIDVRLARLISLRGEARDFISTTGFQGGSTSHHYVVFGFGFGFHW